MSSLHWRPVTKQSWGTKRRKEQALGVIHHENSEMLIDVLWGSLSCRRVNTPLTPKDCFVPLAIKEPHRHLLVFTTTNWASYTCSNSIKQQAWQGIRLITHRAKTATRLYSAGVDKQLMMEWTGHYSIWSYKRTSAEQVENVSDILSGCKRLKSSTQCDAVSQPAPTTLNTH